MRLRPWNKSCSPFAGDSEIGFCLSTIKRWWKAVIGDGVGDDRRKDSQRHVLRRLSEEERKRILLTCN